MAARKVYQDILAMSYSTKPKIRFIGDFPGDQQLRICLPNAGTWV